MDAEQTIAEIEQQKRKKLRNLETWRDSMRRIINICVRIALAALLCSRGLCRSRFGRLRKSCFCRNDEMKVRYYRMTTTSSWERYASAGIPKQATMSGSQWWRRWPSCSPMAGNKSTCAVRNTKSARRLRSPIRSGTAGMPSPRGLASNLYRCGMRPEQACLILRNSAEVVRRHYIRLEQEGTKVELRPA